MGPYIKPTRIPLRNLRYIIVFWASAFRAQLVAVVVVVMVLRIVGRLHRV